MIALQIVTNVVVQIIVLLYLMDNNADTSWMILLGSGVGVLVEAWKVQFPPHCSRGYAEAAATCDQITKAVDIRVIAAPPGSTIPYKLDIRGTFSFNFVAELINQDVTLDKHVLSEDEKKTQEYVHCARLYLPPATDGPVIDVDTIN